MGPGEVLQSKMKENIGHREKCCLFFFFPFRKGTLPIKVNVGKNPQQIQGKPIEWYLQGIWQMCESNSDTNL